MEVKSGNLCPKGYKQAEVGVIPEDWECVPMANVARLESGHTPSKRKPSYWGGTIPWVSLHDTEELDGDELLTTAQMITNEGLNNSSARLLPKGTVTFSRTATVGKTTILGREMATSQDFANYICGLLLHNHFLVYLFRGMSRTWKGLMAGSIHNTIYMPVFKSLKIALPPLPEQRAIATALSDMDALLGALDRLIAKKRNLKQAAMQQLLTGQTRLPGFHREWEVKTMNEVCWFQEGPGVRNTQFTASGVKLLNGTNIFRGALNLESTSRFISEKEAHGAYAHFLADEGDIVLASSGITVERLHEKVAFVRAQELPFCMNTSTIRFKPSGGILDSKFLFQFLTSDGFKRPIGGQATGSAQLNFGPSHVAKVDISLPPLPEQTAIAAVLTDMDLELAVLEQRLAKTRALKQGMMQELLSGRIRLLAPCVAA